MAELSDRVIEQRIRNRVIEYLELVGSFEQQVKYAWAVPIAYVPHEVIEEWQDLVQIDPSNVSEFSAVYSAQEVATMTHFHGVWHAASEALPDDFPPLAEVHALPEWSALRDEARAASAVFRVRGPMPEDREVE